MTEFMVIFGSEAESRPEWTRMVSVVYGSEGGELGFSGSSLQWSPKIRANKKSFNPLHTITQMALVNGRSKLAEILAEEGRWRRSPATAHQDSLAETGKLRTLREGTESIVFVQYGAQGPRPTITMLTGRSGAATTSWKSYCTLFSEAPKKTAPNFFKILGSSNLRKMELTRP